jgi:murein DD-endopeptidase MepM/ murein hydrolase activator NlpD
MLNLSSSITEFILATALATGQPLPMPEASYVPGGIALVKLPGEYSQAPKAYFKKQRVMILPRDNQRWTAVVGIPLSAKPGIKKVTLEDGSTINFEIKDKQYKEQRITIKNKRKVNPKPLDMKRINAEKLTIISAFKHWQENPAIARLYKPAQGAYSSPFGLKRFFNDQPRKPHSGIDIAATKGSPIISPAPGTVTVTGDFFFNGNTVMVDHGQGLVTLYCHLNDIKVEQGQQVDAKTLLGTVGATGRATGPHLHWSVSLNNVRVNPMLMLLDQ